MIKFNPTWFKSFLFGIMALFSFCILNAVEEKRAFAQEEPLRIVVFNVDATPPLGAPVAYAAARTIEDPLLAKGVVLLGSGKPVVLCAIDWIGIGNQGHTEFREKIAVAASTSPDHVAVHALHQHDGVRCDFRADELMQERGLGGTRYDNAFCRDVLERVCATVKDGLTHAKVVTHLGVGKANVEKVASNRRILGPDGKVKIVRYSNTKNNPAARDAAEGLIDPELKMISFWNNDELITALSYYATHPQSYYGQGDVTAEFVGLARAQHEKNVSKSPLIHFNGASGNIAAGKYNDGSHEARVLLTQRVAKGMQDALENTKKQPISAKALSWGTTIAQIPISKSLDAEQLRSQMWEAKGGEATLYAPKLAWAERATDGCVPVEISRLTLNDVSILHLPGELFVEYQLAAQTMKPDHTVCMAAYGDYGPCYIGTEISYTQGGYEVSPTASLVAPETEKVLMQAIEELLK